jgi:hypothetical protein
VRQETCGTIVEYDETSELVRQQFL